MQIFSMYIIELAVFSAVLSLFLEFCFREGHIFEGWLNFWAKRHLPEDVWEDEKIDREDKLELVTWFWFKPLGGCVVCMNVWISFILCLLFHPELTFLSVVLLSSFLVRFFHKKIL